MRIYIKINFANGFIRLFKFFIEISVFFAPKKNKGLRFYVDYRGFNNIIIKNRYFLFFIKNILDRISGARIFIKINIKNVYYRIRIYKDNK